MLKMTSISHAGIRAALVLSAMGMFLSPSGLITIPRCRKLVISFAHSGHMVTWGVIAVLKHSPTFGLEGSRLFWTVHCCLTCASRCPAGQRWSPPPSCQSQPAPHPAVCDQLLSCTPTLSCCLAAGLRSQLAHSDHASPPPRCPALTIISTIFGLHLGPLQCDLVSTL